MLVLSRKVNQTIKIGDDIEVTIVAISGDNVRIGINAPKSYRVLRNEIYDEVQMQNKESIKSVGTPNDFQELFRKKK